MQYLEASKANPQDTLYSRLNKQTYTRKLSRHCVSLLISRLGLHWAASSCQELMYPIVQTMVVQERIGDIATHEEYEECRAASKTAETMLLQQMRETNNRGAKALHDKVRELDIPFVRDNEHRFPVVAEVKQEVFKFGVFDDKCLLVYENCVYLALHKLPPSVINGTACHVREFADLSPH